MIVSKLLAWLSIKDNSNVHQNAYNPRQVRLRGNSNYALQGHESNPRICTSKERTRTSMERVSTAAGGAERHEGVCGMDGEGGCPEANKKNKSPRRSGKDLAREFFCLG